MRSKRILSLLLALLLVLTLTACNVAEKLTYATLNEIPQTLDNMAAESAPPESSDAWLADATAPPAEEISTGKPALDIDPKPTAALKLAAPDESDSESALLAQDGIYTTKEDVALYIHTYGKLPSNFITKKEAQELGWLGGNLEPYALGKCIGGSHFGNYEGVLPDAPNRTWTECDIDTLGASSRGVKRIVFSNDGLIYYTDDHYESFELLYGEE